MPTHERPPSRCSQQCSVQFHWFDGTRSTEEALDRAVAALLSSIQKPSRLWSPYGLIMAKSEFRKRLQKAASGLLKPVDEVKGVDEEHVQPLYEIRWQGIDVLDRDDETSQQVHHKVLVRLYHSEPLAVPHLFIGHHAHEKILDASEGVYVAQDSEIAVARSLHDLGVGVRWYLP